MLASKEFVFVPVGDPWEKTGRRLIRSNAAAYSHRVAPRKGTKASKHPSSRPASRKPKQSTSDSPTPNSQKSSSSNEHERERWRVDPSKADNQPPTPDKDVKPIIRSASGVKMVMMPKSRYGKTELVVVHSSEAESHLDRKRKRARQYKSPEPEERGQARTPPMPTIYYTPLDRGRSDPFKTYPVDHLDWYDNLLDFWYSYTLVKSIPHIRASEKLIKDYTLWSRRQEISEPCLFYISLFLASGIPVTRGLMSIKVALWLRGMAVKTLQEALDHPERALTNATISSVSRVALHEHLYGDRQVALQIHRPAQKRMIAARGGLENLDMPYSTLHMMAWSDSIMAAESGTASSFVEYSDYLDRMGVYKFAPDEAANATRIVSPRRHLHPGYGNSGGSPPPSASSNNSVAVKTERVDDA